MANKKNSKNETASSVKSKQKRGADGTTTNIHVTVDVNVKNGNVKKKKVSVVSKPVTDEERAKKTRRIVIIVISAILAAAILFGIVLGVVTLVRNSSYVMKLDRVGIDKGVASFLISIYKHDYIETLLNNGINASDSNEFWLKKRYTGTEGDLFNYEVEEYLKGIVAANVLFDEYATLTEEDEYKIDFAVQEVLNFQAGGSKKTFNELTSSMGFDFKDFKRGTEMLYKLRVVYTTVFGESGSKMQTNFADYCNRYYESNYIRAKILLIRTQDTYKLDENNEMIKGEDGKYEIRLLTEAEKQERAAYIAQLDACVDSIRSNPENTIALNDFNNLLNEVAEKYNENVTSAVKNGYYLSQDSEYTSKLGLDGVISEAFNLDIGEVYSCETGVTVAETTDSSTGFSYKCYVYRMEKEAKAYQDSSLEHFFLDFNTLASIALYEEIVAEYSKEVTVKDKWDAINPVAIPRNYNYRVKSFA